MCICSPQLSSLDIPITNELVETLGFLTYEMTIEIMTEARNRAQMRITASQAVEDKLEKRDKQAIKSKAKLKGKGKKRKPSSVANDMLVDSASQSVEKKVKQAREETEAELELRRKKEAFAPIGPFSASSMQTAALEPLACPGTVDSASQVGTADESIKVDNSTAMANVVSGHDVLLGDFEEALHASIRQRRKGSLNRRRGARFIDRFR